MAGSPTGAYVGLPLEELQEIRTQLISRIANGDRTGLSGAAKSSSKNYAVNPLDALTEVNYAIGLLTGLGPTRQTTFNNSGRDCYGYPPTVTLW